MNSEHETQNPRVAGTPETDSRNAKTDFENPKCEATEPKCEATTSALSHQVGGSHYRQGGIQPVQYIEANALGFLEGCVVKRLTRHNRAGGKGRQDIEKSIHELQLLLDLRYATEAGQKWVPSTNSARNESWSDDVQRASSAHLTPVRTPKFGSGDRVWVRGHDCEGTIMRPFTAPRKDGATHWVVDLHRPSSPRPIIAPESQLSPAPRKVEMEVEAPKEGTFLQKLRGAFAVPPAKFSSGGIVGLPTADRLPAAIDELMNRRGAEAVIPARKFEVKLGDRVQVMRKADSREAGWDNYWASPMDTAVGRVGKVVELSRHGVRIAFEGDDFPGRPYRYPPHVLAPIQVVGGDE